MLRRSFRLAQGQHHNHPHNFAGATLAGHQQQPGSAGGFRQQRNQLDPRAFVRRPPANTIVNIVPQGEIWVIERLGKYLRTQLPGIHFVTPFLERIRYVYSSKEQGILIPHQSAITRDNVMVEIDGVLFLRIVDAEAASYNIENPIFNLINLAQTTMRSEIGKLTLDNLFVERGRLNVNIVEEIKKEAAEWGVECKRYEIRDIAVSELVRQSMDLQAEAERKKRKLILESEGESKAMENKANGKKMSQQLMAEADFYTQTQAADAQAYAIEKTAAATKQSITTISEGIKENKENADQAISLRVAEQYLEQFGNIAKEGNTVVLGNNMSDPAGFAAQALSVYKSLNAQTGASGSKVVESLPGSIPPSKSN